MSDPRIEKVARAIYRAEHPEREPMPAQPAGGRVLVEQPPPDQWRQHEKEARRIVAAFDALNEKPTP